MKFACKGVSGHHQAKIKREITSRVQARLEKTKTLISARRRSLVADSAERKLAGERERQRKLDKVLNPDKYRTNSPTVRRAGRNNNEEDMPELARSQVYRGPAGSSSISKINANRRSMPRG